MKHGILLNNFWKTISDFPLKLQVSKKFMSYRKLSIQEEKLLELLISKVSVFEKSDKWKKDLTAKPMNDGGMGSLLLLPDGVNEEGGKFGKEVSEHQFKDSDGVVVIASLNIDQNGELFELDIWKTDFSPLLGNFEDLENLKSS